MNKSKFYFNSKKLICPFCDSTKLTTIIFSDSHKEFTCNNCQKKIQYNGQNRLLCPKCNDIQIYNLYHYNKQKVARNHYIQCKKCKLYIQKKKLLPKKRITCYYCGTTTEGLIETRTHPACKKCIQSLKLEEITLK